MDSNFQSLALFEIIFSNDSAFDLVLIIWTVVLIILEQWTVTGQWTSCLALTDHLSASAAPFKSKQWTMQMQKYFVGKNCDLDTEPCHEVSVVRDAAEERESDTVIVM